VTSRAALLTTRLLPLPLVDPILVDLTTPPSSRQPTIPRRST
jgi:hypothetical protein